MKDLRTLGSTGGGQVAELEQEVADLRERLRQVPGVFSPSSEAKSIDLYQVVAGQLLSYVGRQGIVKLQDLLAASALPDPGGGVDGQITTVPAYPWPASLPDGLGVGLRVGTTTDYAYLLNDYRGGTSGPDAIVGDIVLPSGTVTLDKVVGAKTYRYVCLICPAAWW